MGTSWCFGNADSNCVKYGRLYDWETAVKACPSGWKLPDTADWKQLINFAGGESTAGTKLKTSSGWDNLGGYLTVGTDDYGFSALPGGSRSATDFSQGGVEACWWTATATSGVTNYAKRSWMYYNGDQLLVIDGGKSFGYSVRCIKD